MSTDVKTKLGAERFEAVAIAHIDALYRLALYSTGDMSDAQKLVRKTYLKAYESFDKSEAKVSLKAWLLGILNATSDHVRPEGDSLEPHADHDVIGVIGELPFRYRVAILLADVEELSYKEIAYIMDCSEETVAYILCRGRRLVRKGLRSQNLLEINMVAV